MSQNIIIVESPAKAKTIKKYLGKNFTVLASYGHVRDLLSKTGAVDTQADFSMRYAELDKSKPYVDAIVKALKKAGTLYLATDPDREGEAIAWHLCELLKERHILKDKVIHRVVFNQITKKAVQAAIEDPRAISSDLVDAQQARRALDHLVGFNLSPLLWEKVMRGLSAGRVQSPALRMIVEREEEIQAFNPQEYWSILANTEKEKVGIQSKLIVSEGKKLHQFSVENKEQADKIKAKILESSKGNLLVAKIEKKQRKRNPLAPFTTSTLQQEAVQTLRLSASQVMRIAQQLYEGIEIEEGSVGLITYMRTDSVHLASEALEEIRGLISQHYGDDYLPKNAHIYKTKTRNAQEAHEAIRPTSVNRLPDDLASFLSKDQMTLYRLIWERTIASQMVPAIFDTVTAELTAGKDYTFRANGSTLKKPGFLKVYNKEKGKTDKPEKMLPPLSEGEVLPLLSIENLQHFTTPPPRYSEATLIKSLEEHGIGRPSTYASIIATLQSRNYAKLEERRFFPSDVGKVVTSFLTKYFTQYVDYDFTAKMEDDLDAVSRGEEVWVKLMHRFWGDFYKQVTKIKAEVARADVTHEKLDESCPECGKPLSIRLGRLGRFIGCTAFPTCKYTRNLEGNEESKSEPEVVEGRVCSKCGQALVIKQGRYGKFIGCSAYPDCKHVESLEKPVDVGIQCPECKKGNLLKRRSRRGSYFYSCATYPSCRYAVWGAPLDEACPSCNWPITVIKITKRRGSERACPQKSCKFTEPYQEASTNDENT